ncbi:MAG: ferredoxin reductase [Chloroflexi bacterium]|nr:ferredoxin reductase [Chloroflexota bacterium]
MARAAILGRLTWQAGTVVDAVRETPRVRSLVVDIPDWRGHRPGQHLDIRLTAEDGYQTARSYSIASPPEEARLTITVEEIEDGEVSPYLVEEVRAGDILEFRGPVGGYFVWDVAQGGPLFLVAGGSGVAPLMAMLRHRIAAGSDVPVRLLYSARALEDVIYRSELDRLAVRGAGIEVIYTFTRSAPSGWTGYSRRVDRALLEEVAWPPDRRPLCYVCGPTSFVEAVAADLVALGHEPVRVKTERFGPTGG